MSFKETSNCLLFFSAKNFLESIGTTFEYRYTKAEDGKFILQFRALKGSEWKTKPVSFCITHHGLKKDEANNFYSLESTSADAADEAFAIVNVQDFLNQLMLVNGPVGRTPIHKIYKDKSELKIMKPYRFHVQNVLIYTKNLVLFVYELVMGGFLKQVLIPITTEQTWVSIHGSMCRSRNARLNCRFTQRCLQRI